MHAPSHVYSICTTSVFHVLPLSDRCLTAGGGQCMKLSSVSEPSLSSNPFTNWLLPFFLSNLVIPLLFIYSIPCLCTPSPFLFLLLYSCTPPPPLPPSHPSSFTPRLFYSKVFPPAESAHVQGPDAAGCHHGVEVSIQFASYAYCR